MDGDFGIGTILGFVISCILIPPIVLSFNNNSWEHAAIKTGNAEYNSQTAKFEWVDHNPQSPEKSE